MPTQTSKKGNIYFPDGAQVALKATGESVFTDVGVILSAVTATLNYDTNEVETANAGKLNRQIRNMTLAGSYTLGNLEPDSITRMSGGIITQVTTDGTAISTIPTQTVTAGWADNTRYPLIMQTSSSDDTEIRTQTKPTLTSVTLDPSGTPETLAENVEYVIVEDGSSYSGWSIQFISANMSTGSPTTFTIDIVYGTNTPIASETLYAGSSTVIMNAVAMQITHTDDNGKIRRLVVNSTDIDSGGLAFGFKGANEDGIEEMALSFTGKVDSSLTSGRQLMSMIIEDGAE